MKRIITTLYLGVLFACNDTGKADKMDLIGQTIEYQYGESIYHVTIDSDDQLHWEAVAGDELGVKAEETYVAEWIGPGKLFITWGEANGTGVSQVLDFDNGKVYNHLIRGRDVSQGEGEIRLK